MTNRREFLSYAGVAAVAASGEGRAMLASPARRIISAKFRDDSIARLGGDSGNCAMTWAIDDRQFVTVSDGCGWPENDHDHYCNARLFTINGGPRDARFDHVVSFPDTPLWDFMEGLKLISEERFEEVKRSGPGYYAGSPLAVGDRVYQFFMSFSRIENGAIIDPHGDCPPPNCSKLVYSPDNGRTWRNQDGSTPVVHLKQGMLSRETMTFFKEPFAGGVGFIQMGRGYRDNTDGYVYGFSSRASNYGNEMIMFRVPKESVIDRSAYQYFSGLRIDGGARWSRDVNKLAAVHRFSKEQGGSSSVVYNPPLGIYMMAAARGSTDAYGRPLSPPSSLSLYEAPNPWGPWTLFHEEMKWTPAGDPSAMALSPHISPKWISRDGKSIWLTWSDLLQTAGMALSSARGKAAMEAICYPKSAESFKRDRIRWRQYYPYFGFNVQRVDLVIG